MSNQEVIKIMLPLWEGNSASELAKTCTTILGRIVTRNAILGLAYRNRDLFPEKSQERIRQTKVRSNRIAAVSRRRRKKNLSAVKAPYLPTEPFNLPDREVIALTQTQQHDCRWPYRKDGDHYSCGHKAVKGHAYCATHKFIATKQR